MKESAKEVLLKSFLYIKDKEIETLHQQLAASQAREKQRDELLSAFQKFVDSHEECFDFDGFTAQIVTQDDYHEACEAIDAARKDTQFQAEYDRQLNIKLKEELAASQAREVKLRDAALQVLSNKRGEDDWLILSIDCVNLEQALSIPPDTAALEEYVMSRLEVVAFHHDDEGLSYENSFTGNVTLYRLKEKTK